MLQKTEPVIAYICGYVGETFKTYYKLEIPVKSRKKPGDYTIEVADDEVYSFNELDRKVADAISGYNSSKNYFDNAVVRMGEIEEEYKLTDENLARYVDSVNNKFSEHDETFEHHLRLIESAKSYRIPWKVDENVGKIVVEPLSLTCEAKGYNKQASVIKEFVFKNSGTVRIGFKYSWSESQTNGHDANNTFCKLYLNNTVIKTFGTEDAYDNNATEIIFDLNVNNGDVFKFEMSAHCKGGGNTDTASVSISNFLLYANVETPYTYQTLTEDLDSVTAEEVLNTLLGV
jgi:hypothetical protein